VLSHKKEKNQPKLTNHLKRTRAHYFGEIRGPITKESSDLGRGRRLLVPPRTLLEELIMGKRSKANARGGKRSEKETV